MDDQNKENNIEELSPDEQKAEVEALKEFADDELRDKIAEDFGIDPDVEGDLLDKIVNREKANHEKLSGAIKQKIRWRDRAEGKLNPEKSGVDKSKVEGNSQDLDAIVDAKLTKVLEDRDLKSLNLSEEIEEEVRSIALVKGISIREASQHPYIVSMQKDEEQEARVQNATPKRSKKSSYTTSFDAAKQPDPNDFKFDSDANIEEWNQAKEAHREWKKQNG